MFSSSFTGFWFAMKILLFVQLIIKYWNKKLLGYFLHIQSIHYRLNSPRQLSSTIKLVKLSCLKLYLQIKYTKASQLYPWFSCQS